ncbi:MAG: hypothetical protein KAU90_07940, partial [Sulfurovaceae bacterium]|nr:hypothetical protein [Sulfurovaceae bacterium]
MIQRIKYLILIIILGLFGCDNSYKSTEYTYNSDNNNSSIEITKKLRGANINWSFLPEISQGLLDATNSLNPEIIRYPGGTISKTWNWKDGTTTKGNRTPHILDDLLILQKATNTKVIFVLNIIHKTLENQLELLRTAQSMGITINYIEMGNELYLGSEVTSDDSGKYQDNVDAFPSGTEYAQLINKWSPIIYNEFPNVKIGISMFSRVSNDERKKRWNDLVTKEIKPKNFDAYVYHIYISTDNSIELNSSTIPDIIKERIDAYKSVKVNDDSKEVWITEYGVHTDTIEKTVTLTKALADYIETHVNLALAQVLYTKSKTS